MEILLVSILTLHAVCQQYLTRAHNIVDILLLFNLAIINAISFGNYYCSRNYSQRRQNENDGWSAVQLVLIYISASLCLNSVCADIRVQLSLKGVWMEEADFQSREVAINSPSLQLI